MYTQTGTWGRIVIPGALLASPLVGACDCTTFGVDPVEAASTTDAEATTTAETPQPTTTGTPGTTTSEAPTTSGETTLDVLTSTLTLDTSNTTAEPDTSSGSTSTGDASAGTSTGTTADATTGEPPPEAPVLHLEFSAIKQFDFSWSSTPGADFYRLLERPNADPDAVFAQLGDDIAGEAMSWTMPLHLRHQASYKLQACNDGGCADSDEVEVDDPLIPAIGYFKPNAIDLSDQFGWSVDLSSSGDTLVVGAVGEDSADDGVDADPFDDNAEFAGAVTVFARTGSAWSHQAFIKASNSGAGDYFGHRVALSSDGNTLAVSAPFEDSSSAGVNGPYNDGATNAGAVYVFVRDDLGWEQQAYIKASNTNPSDFFGDGLALSGNGNTLVVGAYGEDSAATGVNGNETSNSVDFAGAVYVYTRTNSTWQKTHYLKASNTSADDMFGSSVAVSENGNIIAVGAPGVASDSGAVYVFGYKNATWSQQALIKASNSSADDTFGQRVALSAAGDTLAVGASHEDSGATGINGDEDNDSAPDAGAVYVYIRTGMTWAKQAYIKMSNNEANDRFGGSFDLSASGDQLVVGAAEEDSSGSGVRSGQIDNIAGESGAAYVFVRTADTWSQRAQLKASNADAGDKFGSSVSLAGDGETLAITAVLERSKSVGVDGSQTDDSLSGAGACYVY